MITVTKVSETCWQVCKNGWIDSIHGTREGAKARLNQIRETPDMTHPRTAARVREYLESHPDSTVRQLQSDLSLSSPSVAHFHMKRQQFLKSKERAFKLALRDAHIEGARLGIEAAAKVCDADAAKFHSPDKVAGCTWSAYGIRALDPSTVVQEK